MSNSNITKKLTVSIALLIILSICLCITTFALVASMVRADENIFTTGSVRINLNDGKPVIDEQELKFKPGMTVSKDFFIENNSTDNVFFKLYFGNVQGGLAEVLEIAISDGDEILYQGTAVELSRQNVSAVANELSVGERRTLTVAFTFPEDASNATQNQVMTFDLCADAVQTKNNPDRLFD